MLQELVKHYKNKNELEALALSLDNPGAIFFTTDTTSIIIDGKIFGIGSSRLFIGTQSDYEIAVLAGQIPYGAVVIIEPSYLTFTALEDNCSIGFYNNPDAIITPTIEYSFDKNNWSVLTENKITVPQNVNMYCRGINPDGISGGYWDYCYNYFTGEGKFNVSGDIMTIIDYETMPETMVGTFYNLFGGEGASSRDNFVDIVDASGLILSATMLTDDCYANMFDSCSSMIYGPKIKAEILAPFCYYKMFYNCTSLTTAPELSARTMEKECYAYMFYNCTSLTMAPELPVTTLAQGCYNSMFYNCTSLTTAPELPATTLASNCYNSMFSGCTSLTTAPELPATTLAGSCYNMMFYNCTALTTAPELPATMLAMYCYSYMFNRCTSLTTAPELPATMLASNCYSGMFLSCTSLTTAPELPATTLADSCYQYMFLSCTSLTTVPELPATTLADSCYMYMFYGCTSLTAAPALPATTLAPYCYQYMFYNCTTLTTAPELPAATLANYCYSFMFCYCESLTIAPELPATTLANSCYNWMFYNCTALTTAPELPAATLANYCYSFMFNRCTSINRIKCIATDISATGCTSAWVDGVASTGIFFKHPDMDNWPTGINGIPRSWTIEDMSYVTFTAELDGSSIGLEKLSTNHTLEYITDTATTWNAFDKETNISLNKGDSIYVRGMLSATNAYDNYTQFKMIGKISASGNCNALWNYQDLNSPLKSYCGCGMFKNCMSLTTAPELPATTLASCCYQLMFGGCTSLLAAPELPATTLASYCYMSMFEGCTALTTAPELPATLLTTSCYYSMFRRCVKLNYIKCLATDISAATCTYKWVEGLSSTGTFVKHPDMTNWTTGTSGIPSEWTVKDPYTPQECVKLEITADNVSGRKTTTTIYYTATTNGIYDNGDIAEGKIITGTATSNEFEQNTSYTDTVERTITFEFMGVTATTTITQDVWVDASYNVVLNDQWRLSETQSNPDSTLYDGVYESFSNKGVDNSTATMYIDLTGYTEFDVYIRSYAESNYDYVTISEPNSTTEKASTKGKQNSGQDISSYTKVHYDNLTGEDRITITYRKDSSASNGNDQGYILISKQ